MWPLKAKDVEQLHFDLTNLCNAKCPECVREIDNQCWPFLDKNILSLDMIKQRFTNTQLPRLRWVKFCGSFGDPLTHPDIIEILEHFISEWPSIEIMVATNGGLKNTDLYKKLGKILDCNLRVVIFGIDGLEDTNHLYRVGVNWNKLKENFSAFINAGGCAQWQYILFDHNKHQIFQARDYAIKQGFWSFDLIQSHRNKDINENYLEKNYNINLTNIEKSKTDVKDKFLKLKKVPIRRATQFPKNTTDVNCEILESRDIMIMNDGTVYPCCHMGARMYSRDPKMELWHEQAGGKQKNNLYHFSMQEILENKFFDLVYDSWNKDASHPMGKCTACIETCQSKVAQDVHTLLLEK